MRVVASAFSEVGIKNCNQDGYLIKSGSYNGKLICIAAICDGMGGLDAGEQASNIVISNLETWFIEKFQQLLINGSWEQELDKAMVTYLNDINNYLINYGNQRNIQTGTTASILLLIGNTYYIYHVGDSRIYHQSNGVIDLLTEDQNLAAKKVREGMMTIQQAKQSKERSVLLQCIGVKGSIEVYKQSGYIQPLDSFLLCTDGFYQQLNHVEINSLLNVPFIERFQIGSELKQCVALVRSRGELDDSTGIIVKIMEY